jgi:hypothetical protein
MSDLLRLDPATAWFLLENSDLTRVETRQQIKHALRLVDLHEPDPGFNRYSRKQRLALTQLRLTTPDFDAFAPFNRLFGTDFGKGWLPENTRQRLREVVSSLLAWPNPPQDSLVVERVIHPNLLSNPDELFESLAALYDKSDALPQQVPFEEMFTGLCAAGRARPLTGSYPRVGPPAQGFDIATLRLGERRTPRDPVTTSPDHRYALRRTIVRVEAFQMTAARRASNRDWPNWMHEAWNRPQDSAGSLQPTVGCVEDRVTVVQICGKLPDPYAPGEHVCVNFGDWIIRGPCGDLSVCRELDVDRTYEKL